MIALDHVALLRTSHLAGEQADVADVVLGAGMVAAGQVDVDRLVERDARLAGARDLLGVALGVGGGELAAGIAGAGDEASADRVRVGGEPERGDRGLRQRRLSLGTSEIRRFCQTVSRISPPPSRAASSATPRICATVIADRQHDAEPVQPGCFCG